MPVGGGETAKDVSGWTVDTVNARLDGVRAELLRLLAEKDLRDVQRFDGQQAALRDALNAQREASAAALAAAEKAVQKAEFAAEKRFDAVNEFRQQLGDQAREFMPRREAEQINAALRDKIDSLERHQTKDDAVKSGGQVTWAYVLAGLGALGTVVGIALALTSR